jgi:uncharacterized protein YfaT (DUF1175 family)
MTWIKSKDKLPKPGEIVIFYHGDEHHLGYFSGKTEKSTEIWCSFYLDADCIKNVKFWCPLPKKPEDL